MSKSVVKSKSKTKTLSPKKVRSKTKSKTGTSNFKSKSTSAKKGKVSPLLGTVILALVGYGAYRLYKNYVAPPPQRVQPSQNELQMEQVQ